MGLWRGKKGSSVFYYLRNSNNREKQGIREYQPVVSNPQTSAQIDQRVYMKPAQNLYRELADIIRRSWQGLEYGGKGTQEFFKGALRQGKFRIGGQIPWLDKGDNRAVPGAYQISGGSIPEVFCTLNDSDSVVTSLAAGELTPNTTWGAVSEQLIANNSLKNGDQITFVICASNQEEPAMTAQFGWDVYSYYINTDDNTEVVDMPKGRFTEINTGSGNFSLTNRGNDPFPFLQAAAVIISRLGTTGTYQRSPATIGVYQQGMAYWYSYSRYAAAKLSYTFFGSARSGNWIVDEQAGDSPATREKVDGTFTLAGLTGDKASVNGVNVRVQRYADDNSIAAVYVIPTQSEGQTVYPLINVASGQAVIYDGTGGAFGYIFPADQAELTGKPTIIVG